MLRSFVNQMLFDRKIRQLGLCFGLVVMVGLMLTAQANAAPMPVYTSGFQAGMSTQGGGDFSVGGSFKYTGSGDAITALGLWDQNQNGLASPHDLGLGIALETCWPWSLFLLEPVVPWSASTDMRIFPRR